VQSPVHRFLTDLIAGDNGLGQSRLRICDSYSHVWNRSTERIGNRGKDVEIIELQNNLVIVSCKAYKSGFSTNCLMPETLASRDGSLGKQENHRRRRLCAVPRALSWSWSCQMGSGSPGCFQAWKMTDVSIRSTVGCVVNS
jgi:hypothetical protein